MLEQPEEESGTDKEEEYIPGILAYLPVPEGLPMHYRPGAGYLPRGGRGSRPIEPKQAMQQWAADKVKTDAPQVSQRTLAMILRAEARTTSALLHSKSEIQTKQTLEAAWRRADLPSPFEEDKNKEENDGRDPKRQRFEQDMMTALQNQVVITDQIATHLKMVPRSEDFMELTKAFQISQEASIKANHSLTGVIAKMESRIQQWEETFLPHVLERLSIPVPPSPADTQHQDIEEARETQRYEEVQSVDNVEPLLAIPSRTETLPN